MKETVNTPSGTFKDCILIIGNGQTNFIGNNEIGSIGIKIYSKEWYSKRIGLIKMERIEETDADLFGTTKMVNFSKVTKILNELFNYFNIIYCRFFFATLG